MVKQGKKEPAGADAVISRTLNRHILPQPSDVGCLMLHQHQSPAAGAKGLDANELALLFTIRVQHDVDRITRDVLYLLYDVRVPVLRINRSNGKKSAHKHLKHEIGSKRRKVEKSGVH